MLCGNYNILQLSVIANRKSNKMLQKTKGEIVTASLTPLGKAAKIRLIEIGKPQRWLIEEVRKRTGLYFDDSYLHKIFTGTNSNPTMINAIKAVLELEE